MLRLLQNRKKILGMNARNLQFIRQYNKKKAVSLANDKLQTKLVLEKAGLPVAKLYGVIKDRRELLTFNWQNLPESFVLKPNHGLGGGGIMLVFGKKKNGLWVGTGDKEIKVEDLVAHTSNILDGNFSFSNIPDVAFFEERLRLHPDFKKISWQGMPDIRILIFNNVPVMAMLRLPTKESDGKANLHQGGIGAGIDLITGVTTYATYKDKLIKNHPDTNNPLHGFAIADWEDLLTIAVKASQASGLGYSGVDIVIDKDKGPVILEINGHPGLSIQNANLLPLKDRLRKVADLKITSASQGIKVAKDLFSKEDPLIIKDADDKKILGFMELVTIILPDNKRESIRAKIDTGMVSTTFNRDLGAKLGFEKAIKAFDSLVTKEKILAKHINEIEDELNKKNNPAETGITKIVGVKRGNDYILRPKVYLSFLVKGKKINTEAAISNNDELTYPFIVGRQDLKQFLIDPAKSLTR
ncbi:MAG: sugar-transfer associated ATP-grasp domain-containing protein [Patescibacteria group bacterium]